MFVYNLNICKHVIYIVIFALKLFYRENNEKSVFADFFFVASTGTARFGKFFGKLNFLLLVMVDNRLNKH